MQKEDDKLRKLLGELESIEAPAGFEPRVMRRIAERKGDESIQRPVTLLMLKFAAPMVLLMVVGGLFVFFADREIDTAIVPPLQEDQILAPSANAAPENVAGATASSAPATARTGEGGPVRSQRLNSNGSDSHHEITSEDLAVKGPGETYSPRGFDLNNRDVSSSNGAPGHGVQLSEALSMIGISASCSDDGCRITSLSKGGVAEHAGMSAGDRIISIDGRKVRSGTVFNGSASFKTFQVVRGGGVVNISLSSR